MSLWRILGGGYDEPRGKGQHKVGTSKMRRSGSKKDDAIFDDCARAYRKQSERVGRGGWKKP